MSAQLYSIKNPTIKELVGTDDDAITAFESFEASGRDDSELELTVQTYHPLKFQITTTDFTLKLNIDGLNVKCEVISSFLMDDNIDAKGYVKQITFKDYDALKTWLHIIFDYTKVAENDPIARKIMQQF